MNKFICFMTLLTICCVHADQRYPFYLEPLPYAFDALEPHIDAATMKVHYSGHHAGYVEKLNNALKDSPKLQVYTLSELLTILDKVPEAIQTAVQNNAGGHSNHTFFWKCMTPKKTKPSQRLRKRIASMPYFGSFENFKKQFNEAAQKVFGSGWVWLCLDPFLGELVIITTPNQDSPLSEREKLVPLLALDVWEHAYYLKHQNKRASYIDAWWNVVNWPFVEENYNNAIQFN